MKKGINMQAQVHVGGPDAAQALRTTLPAAFAKANPGMTLAVKRISPPDAHGNVTVGVYIEGEQEPAADFNALARSAINKAVAGLSSTREMMAASLGGALAPRVAVHSIEEVDEEDDDDAGLILAPTVPTPALPANPAALPAPTDQPPSAGPPAPVVAEQPPADDNPPAPHNRHKTKRNG